MPKVPPALGISRFVVLTNASQWTYSRTISPLFGDFSSCCVVKVPLRFALHDMLVAGPAPTTKGGRQNCPLPCRAFLARQNSGPLPFFASLRLRCVRVINPCPLTIIATPNEGAQQ